MSYDHSLSNDGGVTRNLSERTQFQPLLLGGRECPLYPVLMSPGTIPRDINRLSEMADQFVLPHRREHRRYP